MDYLHGRLHPYYGPDRSVEQEEDYPPRARPHPSPYYSRNEPPPHIYCRNEPELPATIPDYSRRRRPFAEDYPPLHYFHMRYLTWHDDHRAHDKENETSVKVYCKAERSYCLTIRDGKVILARSYPSNPFQLWIKDDKFSTRVKDEEGFPSFALVNKATGQAMKHSIGATHPVQLIPYNHNVLDKSILWTQSKDLGDNYRAIRMVNNIRLNVDAFHGDKNHGSVHDGSAIVLSEWKKCDNQRWKIVPYMEDCPLLI